MNNNNKDITLHDFLVDNKISVSGYTYLADKNVKLNDELKKLEIGTVFLIADSINNDDSMVLIKLEPDLNVITVHKIVIDNNNIGHVVGYIDLVFFDDNLKVLDIEVGKYMESIPVSEHPVSQYTKP